MTYTQIIDLTDVKDEDALHQLMVDWDRDQAGVAPGYQGCRVLADKETPGRYLVEVDFSSEEEAKRNNDRPETNEWATKVRAMAGGDPRYLNLRPVCSTYA